MANPAADAAGGGGTAPCLFLSHSGADTDAARELKRRILQSPQARETALTVWFDKDDLEAARDWQEQIEVAITHKATAFAVYVGSGGVLNWVAREVRLGLVRATGANAIPFVPILAPNLAPAAVATLPPFVQQHQAVADPINNPAELARLITAIVGRAGNAPVRLTNEPFVGLRAMTERESDRFFGREAEVHELVDRVRRHRLVAIVADSGAGKSSLAMAGLAPAFRGGALADGARREPDERIWHVLVMRPGADPLEGLRRGVTEAAERMGLSPDQRAGLRRRLGFDDPNEAAYALRCDLPPSTTETLLIVDQFDELLTETPEDSRQPFVDLLLNLANRRGAGGFHVVLTVRVDYFNLSRPFVALYQELQQADRVFRLKRISDAGLRDAVCKPLRMAGYSNEAEQAALANRISHDLGDRPGDLALAQMALWTVWRNRRFHGGSLLGTYMNAGGVFGALAQEAERIRTQKLLQAEQMLLQALFVRLIRLGETGGVLRRFAGKCEFDDARRSLADKLAGDEYGRLLLVSEAQQAEDARIEVCHEALITQWPWLQNMLNAAAADMRILERLTDRTALWGSVPVAAQPKYLATGAEREQFVDLRKRRDDWLSNAERDFVAASERAFEREQRRARLRQGIVYGLLIAIVVVLIGWINQSYLWERYYWYWVMRPAVLGFALDQEPRPLEEFKECSNGCPTLIVVPAGEFTMGAPEEKGAGDTRPQHTVRIARPFAVGKYDVTFDEWDMCVAAGGCEPVEPQWGRGTMPVINVSWHNAKKYVAWLKRMTGQNYRLLSEPEWEYAARAGSDTDYPWGDDVELNGRAMANCNGCGSRWDNKQTSPVGQFPPNAFGLYDMNGNLFQWLEDHWHDDYQGAPESGEPWTQGGSSALRIVRGGGWQSEPTTLRSAYRTFFGPSDVSHWVGLRVARTLAE